MNITTIYKIDPPPYSYCKVPSYLCHPCFANYLEEIKKLENGWYDIGNSEGVFMFKVKDGEVIHSYRFLTCSGELNEEFHKEGEEKDWESIKDLYEVSV